MLFADPAKYRDTPVRKSNKYPLLTEATYISIWTYLTPADIAGMVKASVEVPPIARQFEPDDNATGTLFCVTVTLAVDAEADLLVDVNATVVTVGGC